MNTEQQPPQSKHGLEAKFSVGQYPDLPSKYKLEKLIGDGAFLSVYRGINTQNGEAVAIKIINKTNLNPKQLGNIQNEISIMNKLLNAGGHINVLHLIEFFDTPENCFLILENCDGGEIFNKIIQYTYFSENLARHMFLQLLDAIKFLHLQGVVHRDIKPENLLYKQVPFVARLAQEARAALRSSDDESKVDEGKFFPGRGGGGIGIIKLADFGLAKQLRMEVKESTGAVYSNLKTPCGTAGYTAPEVIYCGVERKRKFSSNASRKNFYSKAVDIWSLGCFLYTVLCGFPPFYDEDHDVLTQKIITADYVFLEPWWDEISADAKDLISRMLVINAEQRITIDEIYEHPWMATAVPLETESYFPEIKTLPHLAQGENLPRPSRPQLAATSPGAHLTGGLASPSIAIKLVFNNPAMSHVNLKLLAQLTKDMQNVDPKEVRFDPRVRQSEHKDSNLPKTPNPIKHLNFLDIFDREDDSSEDDEEDVDPSTHDDTDDESIGGEEDEDKLMKLKNLSISSTSSSDSLKSVTHAEDDYATRLSSVISGMNGDYKFTLNINDLNLLRRRSSVKSGHHHGNE